MDYFDLHCDTAYECYFKNKDFLKNDLAVSAEKGDCFEKWSQVFAVWIRDDLEEPYKLYREILNGLKNKLELLVGSETAFTVHMGVFDKGHIRDGAHPDHKEFVQIGLEYL